MTSKAPAALALFCTSVLHAQRVDERSGNIIFIDSSGHQQQITGTGKDYTPSLSFDKRLVVFARKTQEAPYPDQPSESQILKSELWLAAVDRRELPRPIYQGAVIASDGRPLQSLWSPQLSPDNRYCYFLAEDAVTSHALCRLDMKANQAVFISSAIEFGLVPSGTWHGYPVANVRSYERDPDDGIEYPHYPWYLLSPAGKKIKRVGQDGERLDSVIARVARLPRL